jgi:hypothetical protein
MADTLTTNYGWILPQDQASPDTWGAKCNANFQAIDSQVFGNAQAVDNLTSYGITISSDATHNANVNFANSRVAAASQLRWQLDVSNTAEAGGNVGSDFSLIAYDDTGTLIGSPIAVARRSGAVTLGLGGQQSGSSVLCLAPATFQQPMTCAAAFSCVGTLELIAATGPGVCLMSFGTSAAQWGTLNATSTGFTISGPTGSGNLQLNSSGINLFSGALTITQPGVTSGPQLTLTPFSGLSTDTINFNYYTGANVASIVAVGSPTGTTNTLTLNKGSASLQLDAANDFIFTGSGTAQKQGGGSWAAISDARIKTVDGEYAAGLEAVLALRPVVYRYKGNHDALSHPYYPPHKQFVGLIAQEAEGVMPDLVTLHEGTIDGQQVTDLRALDPSNLIYALINAVKELKAELEALREASGLA